MQPAVISRKPKGNTCLSQDGPPPGQAQLKDVGSRSLRSGAGRFPYDPAREIARSREGKRYMQRHGRNPDRLRPRIRQLVLQMPPPVVAQALGYHHTSTTRIGSEAGSPGADTYLATTADNNSRNIEPFPTSTKPATPIDRITRESEEYRLLNQRSLPVPGPTTRARDRAIPTVVGCGRTHRGRRPGRPDGQAGSDAVRWAAAAGCGDRHPGPAGTAVLGRTHGRVRPGGAARLP